MPSRGITPRIPSSELFLPGMPSKVTIPAASPHRPRGRRLPVGRLARLVQRTVRGDLVDAGEGERRAGPRSVCGRPGGPIRPRSWPCTGRTRFPPARSGASRRRCSTRSSGGSQPVRRRTTLPPRSSRPCTTPIGSSTTRHVSDQLADCDDTSSWVECFAVIKSGLLPVVRHRHDRVPARSGHPGPVRRGYLQGEPDGPAASGRSGPVTDMPGCRSISRATAGSTSTRRAPGRARSAWRRSRPACPLASGTPRPSGAGPLSRRSPRTREASMRSRRLGAVHAAEPGPSRPVHRHRRAARGQRRRARGVAWRRGPRGPISADDTYGSISRPRGAAGLRPAADADRLRVRRARWPTSCRWCVPSSRPWRAPRSRSPTVRRRWPMSGWPPCAMPTGGCGPAAAPHPVAGGSDAQVWRRGPRPSGRCWARSPSVVASGLVHGGRRRVRGQDRVHLRSRSTCFDDAP